VPDFAYYADFLASARNPEVGRQYRYATVVRRFAADPDNRIDIIHHSTAILSFFADGGLLIRPEGWFTRTTMDRLDDMSPRGVMVCNYRHHRLMDRFAIVRVQRRVKVDGCFQTTYVSFPLQHPGPGSLYIPANPRKFPVVPTTGPMSEWTRRVPRLADVKVQLDKQLEEYRQEKRARRAERQEVRRCVKYLRKRSALCDLADVLPGYAAANRKLTTDSYDIRYARLELERERSRLQYTANELDRLKTVTRGLAKQLGDRIAALDAGPNLDLAAGSRYERSILLAD
jgi:hypothetical protein